MMSVPRRNLTIVSTGRLVACTEPIRPFRNPRTTSGQRTNAFDAEPKRAHTHGEGVIQEV
jgi:hypothetical protein